MIGNKKKHVVMELLGRQQMRKSVFSHDNGKLLVTKTFKKYKEVGAFVVLKDKTVRFVGLSKLREEQIGLRSLIHSTTKEQMVFGIPIASGVVNGRQSFLFSIVKLDEIDDGIPALSV